MVDKISDFGNIITFPPERVGKALSIVKSNVSSSTNSSNTQDLVQIAQDIFTRMTKAAEALVKDDSPANFQKLEQTANSLLRMNTLSQREKNMVLAHLERLSGGQATDDSLMNLADSQKANLYLSNQLQVLKINLEINSWDNTDSSLQALHKTPRNTGQPAWSDQLFAILTKTTVPESGRIMMHDNLAGLYDHHLNMFIMNKRQEPYWDIVQTASFVLDIADEEFKQEEEYDKKTERSHVSQADQTQMPQLEITVNDLKPISLDPFTQRRLKKTPEEKYNTNFEITLRTDFKKSFLKWIEINLQDFQEAGFGTSPLKIFNQLCVSAKEGQDLRRSQD